MSTGIRKRGRAYEASVWDARENKRIRKSFPSLREAKDWRAETRVAFNANTMSTTTQATLREAWDEWLEDAESGLIRNRSGDDDLHREGLDPSTIRNTLMPLRALYRRLLQRGLVTVNPTANLTLPAVRGRRDRIVTPEEAGRLLSALPRLSDHSGRLPSTLVSVVAS